MSDLGDVTAIHVDFGLWVLQTQDGDFIATAPQPTAWSTSSP